MERRCFLEDGQIVEFTETPVAVLEHRGPDSRLGVSLRKFIAWRQQNKLPPRVSATFNVAFLVTTLRRSAPVPV